MSTLEELTALVETEEGKEKLRVMLAELRGWKQVKRPEAGELVWVHPRGIFEIEDSLPDYPRDLNACHEAATELWRTDAIKSVKNRHRDYSCHLIDICNPGVPFEKWTWGTAAFAADATATQRCIALILALQKP